MGLSRYPGEKARAFLPDCNQTFHISFLEFSEKPTFYPGCGRRVRFTTGSTLHGSVGLDILVNLRVWSFPIGVDKLFGFFDPPPDQRK